MKTPVSSNDENRLGGDSDQGKIDLEAAILALIAQRDSGIAAARADRDSAIAAADAAIAAVRAEFWSNPYALMMEPLPFVEDISSKVGTSSEAVGRLNIPVVKEALDFKKKQAAYTLSIKPEFEQRRDIKRYPEGVNQVRKVATEMEIFAVLTQVVFVVLGRLIPEVNTASPKMAGSPVLADAASYIVGTKKPIVLYEFKRQNLVFDSVDMVLCCQPAGGLEKPRGAKHALDALSQLVGYMASESCPYGILTSYQYFWAVELCENGDILVSPAYASTAQGENSVMSMLCYVIHTAYEWKKSGKKFTPPPLAKVMVPIPKVQGQKSSDRIEPAKAKSKDTLMHETSNDWNWHPRDGFEFLRFLVDQKDRITLQVRLGDGRLAAVKAFDTKIDRDIEVKCYRNLERLQIAGSIPMLLNGDLELEWPNSHERRVHALVMEWVGPLDVEGGLFELPPLPVAALVSVRKILEEMHESGIAHGDVRSPNVIYDSSTGRVAILDFGHSCTSIERDFVECCQQDLRSVDLL